MVENLLLLLLLVVGTLPLVLRLARGAGTGVRAAAFGGWALGLAAIALASVGIGPPEPVLDRPIEVNSQGYVSSDACQSCHPSEYATWYRSYHRTMTQPATTETVAGPLEGGVEIPTRGQTIRLEARGEEVWAEMDDPSFAPGSPGIPRIERKVVMTTGSHQEQFFWTSMGGRKMSLLPVMYRLGDEQRWAQLDGCCISPPTSVQEGENARWNRVCNRCHSTHASPRIDETGDVMDTHAIELGIACEACHGPGETHVAANRDPRRRYQLHADDAMDDETITNPLDLDHRRGSMVCAQCHSTAGFLDNEEYFKWKQDGYSYRPGEDLFETRSLYTEGEDKFWDDGMVRVSGREFSGMHRAPCYTDGEMGCTSCHQMHPRPDDPRSLDEWADDMLYAGMDGNLACTQCHSEYSEGRALLDHTHHPAGSSGSECMNCHMPYTTYGLLKGIRSHEVGSPSVQESVEYRRPNACNQCHLDQTMAWAAGYLEDWYGIEPPPLSRDQRTIAASILWAMTGDSGQRALMAWSFGWPAAREASGSDWMSPFLIALMRDPYHAVRYIAARSFEQQPEADTIRYDFMAPMETMLERTTPAFEAWSRKGSGREADPSKLVEVGGGLDLDTFMRLFDQRDNRALTLNE